MRCRLSDRYYVRFRGRVLGPFTAEKTAEMVRRGQVTRVHELSPDGLSWKKAEEFAEFFGKANVRAAAVATVQAESQSTVTETKTETPAPVANQWHVHCEGQEYGPIEESVLLDWIRQGRVRGDNMVWRQGMQDWETAETAQPNWFLTQSSSSSGKRGSQQTSLPVTDELDSRWLFETTSKVAWLYFLSVAIIIVAALSCIGGGIFFIRGIAIMRESRALGTNLLIGGLGTMLYAGMMLITGVLLLRYTNAVSTLRSLPTVDNAVTTAQRLSLFWFVTALFMILLIGFVAFGVLVELLADIST